MGIGYGKVLVVNGESSVFGSQIRRFDQLSPYLAGNTDGAMGRRSGNSFWDGHYFTYARDADAARQPAIFPNDSFTLSGIFDSSANRYTGTARCNLLEIDWPIEAGDYVFHKIGFLCNGALSTDATVPTDTSIPCPMPTEGLVLKVGGATVANVNYMKLRISAECVPYCDSTANGQMMHAAGPLDAKAIWRVNSDDPADWPTIGALHTVDMYVTAAKYWRLQYMRIRGIDPMYRDHREERKLVGYQVVAEFAASDCTQLGSIVNPAGVAKWNS